MRGATFRVLAGLLALGFGFVLLFGDTTKLSGRELIGIAVIGFGFGVYAIFWLELVGEAGFTFDEQPRRRQRRAAAEN